MIAVYKITNPEGKIYIGGTKQFERRVMHYRRLEHVRQTKLYASFVKFGFEAHIFEVVEVCSLENLAEREAVHGHALNVLSEDNLNDLLPRLKGYISASESKRKRISEALKGEKNCFYGKTHSKETKEKLRKAQLGRKHTPEHRKKVSENNAKNNAKIVIDLVNGIYYESAKEASDVLKINHSTLKSRLNGALPNPTNLRYC